MPHRLLKDAHEWISEVEKTQMNELMAFNQAQCWCLSCFVLLSYLNVMGWIFLHHMKGGVRDCQPANIKNLENEIESTSFVSVDINQVHQICVSVDLICHSCNKCFDSLVKDS